MALEKDTTTTGELSPKPVTPDPDALAELRKRLRQSVGAVTHFVPVGAVLVPQKPTFDHGCPGELGSVTYQDSEGKTHLASYSWYACENHLELGPDLVQI
ncbi:hypothetical protein [uncultured Williamsia sp.]|uniref:hypothetical protein n=1 Tax=uncultured Williamsia sp. TaxID=259311 RepID=UPI00261B5455|nr:hypothetical protein [uncultured Williamsia sp.]